MRNTWEIWPEGFGADYCDALLNRAQEIAPFEGAVGLAGEKSSELRSSIVRWLDVNGVDEHIARVIMLFAKAANRNSFGFDIVGPVDAQLTEYHASQSGKYDWHEDVAWGDPAPHGRKLSFVAQLSDPSEYEGGDFEFFRHASPGPEFKKRGAVLVFPSFLHHRVTPVTAGVRRSLVSWIEGPKFR